MDAHKHPISAQVQIRFQDIRAVFDGALEGRQGVFGAGGAIAAMREQIRF
jgi:hypothetical protein